MNFINKSLVMGLILVGLANTNYLSAQYRSIGKFATEEDIQNASFGDSNYNLVNSGEMVLVSTQTPGQYIYGEVDEKYELEGIKFVAVVVEREGDVSGINPFRLKDMGKFNK